jgi:hypothetical protein
MPINAENLKLYPSPADYERDAKDWQTRKDVG